MRWRGKRERWNFLLKWPCWKRGFTRTSENILRPYSFWTKRKRQIPKWLICANVLLHRFGHSRNGWFWTWLLWICIRLDPELFAAKKKELINNYSFLFFSFNWTKIQMDCYFINDVSWLILSFDRLLEFFKFSNLLINGSWNKSFRIHNTGSLLVILGITSEYWFVFLKWSLKTLEQTVLEGDFAFVGLVVLKNFSC